MSNIDEEKVEKLAGSIVEGIERTLNELGSTMPDQVDALSQKQLRRALKATINYIYKKDPELQIDDLGAREQKFLGSMFSLVEAGAGYTMHILGELQQEQDKKRREEESNAEKGEE